MQDFNFVNISGCLGKNAYVKSTTDANGQMSNIYGFSICVNSRKNVNGQWVDEPNWVDCVFTTRQQWSLQKGEKVIIQGKLSQKIMTDQQTGAEVRRLRVLVDRLEKILMTPKEQTQPAPAPQQYQQMAQPAQQYQQPQQQYQQQGQPIHWVKPTNQSTGAPINDGGDDIPF